MKRPTIIGMPTANTQAKNQLKGLRKACARYCWGVRPRNSFSMMVQLRPGAFWRESTVPDPLVTQLDQILAKTECQCFLWANPDTCGWLTELQARVVTQDTFLDERVK